MDSILTSIKKMLGIEQDYTQFDQDIIIDINSALMAATQLGIGPETGFLITGSTETWANFIGTRTDLDSVKTLIYLKVRLLFDPPTIASVLESMERLITEYEWRLKVQVEYVIPTTSTTGGVV